MNNHSVGPLKPPLDPFPANPISSLSPKHHPSSTTASVKRTGGSYVKMHLDRVSRTPTTTVGPLADTSTTVSVNGSLSSHTHYGNSSNSEPMGGLRKYSLNAPLSSTLPPKMSGGVPLQRPSLPMSSAQRHNSFPDAFNNSIPTSMESSANTSMILTWPRAQAVHGGPIGKGSTAHVNHVGQHSVRMSQQISADAARVVGGGTMCVCVCVC